MEELLTGVSLQLQSFKMKRLKNVHTAKEPRKIALNSTVSLYMVK